MFPLVDTKDPAAVEAEVQATYLVLFPGASRIFIPRIFGWAVEYFTGNYRDYQAIDALYHDFEHTLQGTLCMSRLLKGRAAAGAQPKLTREAFELGILAILLHDTGYLKKRSDTEGTGAKYTATHVERSANFAAELMREKGFNEAEIAAVRNMIFCTGVNADLKRIPFQNDLERIVGHALGTADLLGQMAAEDYVEKLPILYEEFAEAAACAKGQAGFIASFTSAEDLLRKTPGFWEKFVVLKLEHDFGGIHRFLSQPYPTGPNYYLARIENNVSIIKGIIGTLPGSNGKSA